MQQKYYLIIGIIVLVAIIGIVSTSLPSMKDAGRLELQILPYIDAEATVTSLFLDDLYSDCEAPEVCPRDRVTLKIDKINRTGDPNDVINLNVGDEDEFPLKYSARPAKLRGDLTPSCRAGEVLKSGSCVTEGCEGHDCSVSFPQYAKQPAELQDSYIIYHLPQITDDVTEKILPGLEEDSKIKFRIWQLSLMINEIGEYEII
ncbi:MAG: hypothetical protein ABIG30_00915 [Candidatus Aenigmatarchaeota archaeon]